MSELRLRMGPTPPCVCVWECECRLDELMTEGPWRRGVMGAAAAMVFTAMGAAYGTAKVSGHSGQ